MPASISFAVLSSFAPRKNPSSGDNRQPRLALARFVLATLMAFGIALPWAIAMVIALEQPVQQIVGKPNVDYLQVRSDGTPVIHTVNYYSGLDTYRFVDGRQASPAEIEKWKDDQWLEGAWLFSGISDEDLQYRLSWRERLMYFQVDSATIWYLVHDGRPDGHAYFAAYNSRSKALLGYLGTTGFTAEKPAIEQQFRIDGRRSSWRVALVSHLTNSHVLPNQRISRPSNLPKSSVYLLSGDAVWHVDLKQLSAEKIAEFPDAMNITLAPPPPGTKFGDESRVADRLLVRTKTSVEMIEVDGQRLARWILPEYARGKDLRHWYDLGDGKVLTTYLRRMVGNHLELELLWLDSSGQIERRQTIEESQGGLDPDEVWTIAPAIPMPAVLTAMFLAEAPEIRGPDYSSDFAKVVAIFWPALLILYVLSAVLAWLAYWRQRRYALPGAGAWAVFVTLLGVPGWLAYRWHRRWPVLLPCAECHHAAPRDREHCVVCGAVFAPPSLTGSEVFG